jgi:hypothetical protein
MKRREALVAIAALPFLAGRAARAEDTGAPPFQGTWTATSAGGKVLSGFWTAEDVSKPDVVIGVWTLVDEKGKTVMNGSWTARREKRGWRGAWSARVGGKDEVLSGTWDAKPLKGAKTLQDLLSRSTDKQVAGTWHMGHAKGNWWLRPKPERSP